MSENQTVKLRFKTGSLEVEYEGSESFLQTRLFELLQSVSELHEADSTSESLPPSTDIVAPSGTAAKINLSTNSIAAKLGCSSGPELATAAFAYLTFVKQKETFERKEILGAMKGAEKFYRMSYGSNLTNTLEVFVKDGSLLEQSAGVYSLSEPLRRALESKLAS